MDALVTTSSGNVTTLGPKARKRALLFPANVTTLLAVVTILAACQSAPQAQFCQIAKPMRPTAAEIDAMTDQSIAAMLSHNERGKVLCGWRP